MHDRPRARTEGIVSERIDGELVVYDAATQTAHCLSAEAASVWEHCDGDLSTVEIADRLELPPESVERALGALSECALLDEGPAAFDASAASERGYSRREAAFRLAKVGGAAFAGPLVYSVAVGTAQAAFSGTPFPACGTTGATSGCSASGSTPVGSQPPSDTCNGTTGTSGACTGARRCSPGPPTPASTTRRAVTACAIAQRITHAVTRSSAQRSSTASSAETSVRIPLTTLHVGPARRRRIR